MNTMYIEQTESHIMRIATNNKTAEAISDELATIVREICTHAFFAGAGKSGVDAKVKSLKADENAVELEVEVAKELLVNNLVGIQNSAIQFIKRHQDKWEADLDKSFRGAYISVRPKSKYIILTLIF